MSDRPRSFWLVLNMAAASDEAVRAAVTEMRARGHAVEVRVVWEGKQIGRFARLGDRLGFDVVVVAGGDGSINAAINGLFERGRKPHCALGILPGGTANDFANAAHLPLGEPLNLLQWMAEQTPTPIDLGRLNGRLFANVASGGFGAEVTTSTPAEMKQMLGGFAYFLTGMASVTGVTARPAVVRGPDWAWEGNLLGLAVGNGRRAGGGFEVTWQARLNDRLLDVLVIPDVGWAALLDVVQDLLVAEQPHELAHCLYKQVPWLEVIAPEGFQINLDGEPIQARTFRFDVLPAALPVFLNNPDLFGEEATGTEPL